MRLLTKSLVFLSLSTSYHAFADTADVKQSLMNKLKGIHYFSAKFNQTVFDTDNNVLQQGNGTIVVSKPNKVHWLTTSPEESLIVSDGETLWLYDPFIEQVSAFSLERSVANTPILLLTNESKDTWDNYQVNEKSNNVYEILAIDEQSQVKSLVVSFKGEEISGLVINDATGQKSEITLSENNHTQIPSNELFTFTVPEGVLLDDQR